jgi:hypothetical protein
MNTAEQMLKKALEFANQGMETYFDQQSDDYATGKYYAYEDMASYLEMLIKEAEQNETN